VPPRYSYWTIIVDGAPTAFRAAKREELLPTFERLRRKHPSAELRWFSRGRLWASPEAQRQSTAPPRERRGPEWRPGGKHQDPRDRFKKERERRRERRMQEQRGDRDVAPREPGGERPPRERRGPAPWRRDRRPPPSPAAGGPPERRAHEGGGRPRERRAEAHGVRPSGSAGGRPPGGRPTERSATGDRAGARPPRVGGDRRPPRGQAGAPLPERRAERRPPTGRGGARPHERDQRPRGRHGDNRQGRPPLGDTHRSAPPDTRGGSRPPRQDRRDERFGGRTGERRRRDDGGRRDGSHRPPREKIGSPAPREDVPGVPNPPPPAPPAGPDRPPRPGQEPRPDPERTDEVVVPGRTPERGDVIAKGPGGSRLRRRGPES
jgi:hypothetical protein